MRKELIGSGVFVHPAHNIGAQYNQAINEKKMQLLSEAIYVEDKDNQNAAFLSVCGKRTKSGNSMVDSCLGPTPN